MYTIWTTKNCVCVGVLLGCQGSGTTWFTELGFSSLDSVKVIATKIKRSPTVFLEGRTILLRSSLVASVCNSCCLQKNQNLFIQNSILGVVLFFLETWPKARVLWCKSHSALMCGLAGVILPSDSKEALSDSKESHKWSVLIKIEPLCLVGWKKPKGGSLIWGVFRFLEVTESWDQVLFYLAWFANSQTAHITLWTSLVRSVGNISVAATSLCTISVSFLKKLVAGLKLERLTLLITWNSLIWCWRC